MFFCNFDAFDGYRVGVGIKTKKLNQTVKLNQTKPFKTKTVFKKTEPNCL
jgi:hypothetical protein